MLNEIVKDIIIVIMFLFLLFLYVELNYIEHTIEALNIKIIDIDSNLEDLYGFLSHLNIQ